MKNIYIMIIALCLPTLTYALDLDTPVTPMKNMTEGGMFSDPEELPVLPGDTEAFKDVKKIFIPYFKVSYNKNRHGSSSAEGGNLTTVARATVHANVETTGYSEEVFQKITNQAYEDLAARFAKKGFTLISREEAKTKSEAMQDKLKDGTKEFPDVDDDTSVYVAEGTAYPTGWMAGLLPDDSLSMSPNDLENELEAGMVSVGYTVNYVTMGSETSTNRDSVAAELSLGAVVNVGGYLQMFEDGEQSRLDMGQVAYSDIAFGKLENTTSTAQDVALGAVAVLGFMMGSSSSLDIEDYTLTVNEEKFVAATLDALKKANEGFVNAF